MVSSLHPLIKDAVSYALADKIIPYPGPDATTELLDIQIDRMFRQIGDFEIIEKD